MTCIPIDDGHVCTGLWRAEPMQSGGGRVIDLDAIEARASAATPGPWHAGNGGPGAEADAVFCAHARTDVPALVAYARELEEDDEYAGRELSVMKAKLAAAVAVVEVARVFLATAQASDMDEGTEELAWALGAYDKAKEKP